jgi:hypothetical protein
MAWCAVGAEGGSIVPNGDFGAAEKDAKHPSQWAVLDGRGVQWGDAPGGGKGIRMDTAVSEIDMDASWKAAGISDFSVPNATKDPIAATYGLSYYSDAVPVEAGRTYRLRYEFQGDPAGVKVWVRGYGDLKGEKRKLWEAVANGANGVDAGGGWRAMTMEVAPTAHRPVAEVKVMLYAYWPAGTYWFRRVTLEPLPKDEAKRQP